MTRRIYSFEHEGKPALGFDTGLDARAFAQARLAQLITEPGVIVFPDGTSAVWLASGVAEAGGPPQAGGNGASMVVWGPPFEGERLDLLVNDSDRQDAALTAAARWIGAHFHLAARNEVLPASVEQTRHSVAITIPVKPVPLNMPCAALIAADGTVFLAPPSLALRCVQVEGEEARLRGREWYVHPDFSGEAAAAFTAAAMLYQVFSLAPPFPAQNEEVLHQDMREGNFLPVRLAVPGLDERLACLMQTALSPPDKTAGGDQKAAPAFLGRLLEILKSPDGNVPAAASFFHPLSEKDRLTAAKEKERFLKKKNITVNTRRFVIRNTAVIAGCAAAVIIAVLTARGIVKSRAELPTTRGMSSGEVIQSYYGAFGELDHQLMDACVTKGAGKGDIEMVVNLFVITRVRQAYETGRAPLLVSASEWKNSGAEPAASQVFGVTDLEIERVAGGEADDEIRYRARYTLWTPWQSREEGMTETVETVETAHPPQSVRYTDELTLVKNKGDWRIAAISRAPGVP